MTTKWQPKTRGGYEYEVFAEREGKLWGRAHYCGGWMSATWGLCGESWNSLDSFDLIPINEAAELLGQLTSTCETHFGATLVSNGLIADITAYLERHSHADT